MFFKQTKQQKAEKLFNKILVKHNKLLEYEVSNFSSKRISFIEKIIRDYSTVVELSSNHRSAFLNRGLARISLAKIYMGLEQDDEALEILDLAMMDLTRACYLDESSVDSYVHMAVVNYNLYKIYKKMSKNDIALHHLKYVMEDYNTLLTMVEKNQIKLIISEKALVEFDLAELYLLTNKDKALTHFGNSIGHYLEIFGKISEETDIEANFNMGLAESKIASIYKERKEYHFAGISLESSNTYFIKLLDYSLEKSSFSRASILYDISMNLSEMGRLLEGIEDYHNAIDSHEESIAYATKSLAIEPLELEALSNRSSSRVDIAKNYLLWGQNREAIVVLNEGKDGSLSVLSSNPEDVIAMNTLAMTYTELANIYRFEMIKKQDESIMKKAEISYLESIKYYKKALKIDAYDAPTYINLAGSYYELALFFIYIKKNEKSIDASQNSLDMLGEALKIDRTLDLTNNIHASKLKLSEAYKIGSQYDKALDVLESSIVDNQDSKNRANILSEIGRLYAKRGEIERALEFFDKAFNYYLEKLKHYLNKLYHLENFSILLESILKISQKSSYIDKALWCNHEIIDIYDGYFIDIGFEEDSFSMSQKMLVPLHRLLDVYVLSGKEPNEKLVEALEGVKSKRLKQLVEANHFESKSDEERDSEVKQLKIKLDVVKREIGKDEVNIFNMDKKEKLYEEFQDYSQQLSKMLNLKKDKLDIYQNLDYKSLLIYPIYSGRKLTLIAVEKKDKIEVTISQTILKEDIKFSDYLLFIKYMEGLIEEDKFSDRDSLEIINNIKIDDKIKKEILTIDEDEFMEEYKYEIVQIALLHIRDEIIKLIPKGIDKILFSPFVDLNMLPLHAISTEENGYLIEKYEISYVTSLSLMKNSKTNRTASLDNLFVSMEGLHDEATHALDIIGGEHLKEIKSNEFKEYIEDKSFNVLHLSTHGSANLSNPLNAYLQFNESNLHLLEIFGLNIDANLVNISACETYLSTIKGADEVLAFERAFLIAGAKSVVSTFSTVSVMRTEDFMEIFYNKIKKEGGSISKSFQKASMEDIENGSMEWSLFRFTS